MAVGIVGLGIMGTAYATHLVAAGEQVCGGDPLPEARKRLVALGGTAHESAGEWLADCDPVILSLASPAALRSVIGILQKVMRPGQIVLETGTFRLADKESARDALDEAGVFLLDCTVSGTGAQAMAKDIVMMASGPPEAVARARPVMTLFTRKVIEAGSFGAGTRLKFVANHAVALHNTAAAETLHYAMTLGLHRDVVYEMLSTGAGQSKMSDLRMPLMMRGEYEPPTASLKMFEKDLSVIGEDIERIGVSTPLFDVCVDLYDQARAQMPETHDTAAVYEVYRRDNVRT